MKRSYKWIKSLGPANAKDSVLAFLVLVITFVICFAIRNFINSNIVIPIFFLLAVFLISRFTDGYVHGTLASIVSVLGVNYVFTYPYFSFNFTLSGYPLTIMSMLTVAIITSALTTRIKLEEAAHLEAELEKTRSNLLRAVSHDLRTPLTSILGSTSAIIENDKVLTSKERIQLLQSVQEDAQWLIGMVENLLSVTKINQSGKTNLIKTSEVIDEVVGDTLVKFRKRYPNIQISVQVPEDVLLVPMDSILIEQVLINLLENAAIHSKTATLIKLGVMQEDNYVIFSICDNGVGIPKEVLPHIFKGYYKQKEDSVDKKRNMGIGLSVCYTIIVAHGGTMTAENAKSGGAIFRFTLPMKE